ncbi:MULTISPECIES: aminodeoxychorismate lyase [Pantoea]|uniref:Aminodeoxychorismate lyase n=1 Tax=Pantoea brenneri TaxID=472694 RepID=A0A7Y6NEY7_9GAMM|nr:MULTISPECIES: aminodeoxychorismate lyase [Pantoea]MBZ6395388.1 aminodeoxychorismate lyase [Pantoea sp.]MBZ6437238.1 aminodeoxychorismate lyase [Pantoea sp.]MCQ5471383.1 aminodeoxychorismate lyase [Pantoea brenneri]MDU4745808.1 aminodeoxychorismate lyase [Pantoea sp.]NUY42187.1 aminodeoxychorismate lyase [Pantoea brenneri]
MWINGIEQSTLAASDRGLQFGDGCFTTAAVQQGKILLLERHIQRLREGCERLLINGIDWLQLENEMRQAARDQRQAVLKVILSAGSGGRGYSRKGGGEPTRIVSLAAWPQHYADLQQRGASLALSPIRLARNPQFAGLKHLNRLEQVMIRAHLDQTDADEALVLDTEGWVVECCAANLFWRRGSEIFTPDLRWAGVDGIMRRSLMAQLAAAGQACRVVQCEPDALLAADEIVICNALMPVLPVRQLEAVNFTQRTLFNQLHASCKKIMDAS